MSKEEIYEYHGAVKCESCHSIYQIEGMPEVCTNCGTKLDAPKVHDDVKLLGHERLQSFIDSADNKMMADGTLRDGGSATLSDRIKGPVTCCWCGEYYSKREEKINCDSCGGNLPMPACTEPGPKPEMEPRILPKGYWKKLFISHNITLRVSLFMIFSPVILFFIMPPLALLCPLGILLLMWNFYDLNKRYKSLKKGKSVLGRIEKVQLIGEANKPERTEQGKVDAGLMFRLYFIFEVNGQTVKGVKLTHDPVVQDYFSGQPIWVVYLEKKTKCYSLWPPIA